MRKKVSLKDIADKANVTTAAVSYVLNGQEHKASPAMVKKIKSIAQKLNYRPNHIAKSLKTKKTHTIGLVVADISYRYTTGITRAIEAEARKNNYTVLIGSSDEDPDKFRDLVGVLVDRQVDGLLLLPVENSEEEIKLLNEQTTPFILLDRYFPSVNTNFIALDNYNSSRHAVDYLVSLGHTEIAFINYKSNLFHLKERSRGYRDAVKAHHLTASAKLLKLIRADNFQQDLTIALDQLLQAKRKKMGVIFASDTLAIKGIKYLALKKVKIPGDLSVFSFDESEAFELFQADITHSRQPLEEMGRVAVQTLLDVFKNGNAKRHLLFNSGFVKGRSCGETL
jgi:LacI family transcriptional regulator